MAATTTAMSPAKTRNSPMSAPARRAANICAAFGSRSAFPMNWATSRNGSGSWARTGGVPRPERRRRLLELHCPHRGTSLEFGLIDAKGIRCCYHGWLFAPDGTILETPGEPADSTLKDRLFHGAYPTHEYAASSSPTWVRPTQQPPFPVYDSFVRPGLSAHPRPEILLSLQLAADHGKRDGPRPYRVSPHHRQRRRVHQ